MPLSLIVTPEAELDLSETYEWYEDRRPGLGEDFLSSADACLQTIRRLPKLYPVVHESFRRALIRRFPYAVFYEHSDWSVTIYAIFHTSRDPQKWRRRLSA